jgi:hypothetical protein
MSDQPNPSEPDDGAVVRVEVASEDASGDGGKLAPARRPATGTACGTVKQWSEDEGWGVIVAKKLPRRGVGARDAHRS